MLSANKDKQLSLLHIDLGNQSIIQWLKQNKYIVHSELIRYSEFLLASNIDSIQALLISNFTDNVVFILTKENLPITLSRSMDYFLSIEEYELCSKIRDLQILIEKTNNEVGNTKNSKSNKGQSKVY